MTVETLNRFLKTHQARFRLIRHERPIVRREEAEGIFPPEQAVSTLILQSGAGLIAALAGSGRGRLDLNQLKLRLNVPSLTLAPPHRVKEKTGFAVGAAPLIGHGLPCLVDKGIRPFDFIYGGSGDPLCTLEIAPEDVIRLNKVILFFD